MGEEIKNLFERRLSDELTLQFIRTNDAVPAKVDFGRHVVKYTLSEKNSSGGVGVLSETQIPLLNNDIDSHGAGYDGVIWKGRIFFLYSILAQLKVDVFDRSEKPPLLKSYLIDEKPTSDIMERMAFEVDDSELRVVYVRKEGAKLVVKRWALKEKGGDSSFEVITVGRKQPFQERNSN